jgi:pimeloyl-ACP methyl ester carboxylesterase
VPASGPLPQPSKRCGDPATHAKTIRFTTKDGVVLDAAVVGKGPVGAVLIHEHPGPLCLWWPYADYLARHGVHALLFDMRCYGLSACPASGHTHPVDDVAAAIGALRRDGARSVALVGASMGGAVAVVAAARLHPAALVNLSGEKDTSRITPVDANAGAAATKVLAPALFVVARRDPVSPVRDMRAVADRARASTQRLIVLPAAAGHGIDMLVGAGTEWSPLAAQVAAFIRRHGG